MTWLLSNICQQGTRLRGNGGGRPYSLPTLVCIGLLIGCVGPDVDPTSNEAVEIVLEEDFRVGGISGGIEYTFGYVSAMAVGPDGMVYAADNQGPVIRQYDSSGVHIRDIGRSGQGPGEYSSVDGMAVLSTRELVIWDMRNSRVSYFSPEGEFVRSALVAGAIGGDRDLVVSKEDEVYVRVMPEEGLVESPDGFKSDWARVNEDGSFDRVASIPLEESDGPHYVLAGRGGYYRPFSPSTLSALGPDGSLFSGRNTEYRITRTYPDGSTADILREEQPIAVTDEELSQWREVSNWFVRRQPDMRDRFFPIPTTKPFFRELVVDSEGRLWVSRYTEAVHVPYSEEERADRERRGAELSYVWRDKPRWDIFDSENNFIGFVELPFKTSFVGASADYVWGIQAGDYREDYIVRWRWPHTVDAMH